MTPATDFGGMYFPGERIPVPDAVEANTESAWALFNELNDPQAHPSRTQPTELATQPSPIDGPYAATRPAGLDERINAPARRKAEFTAETVLLEARRNNRVCPKPMQWQLMYDLLPVQTGAGGRQEPLPPPAGAVWQSMPSLSKRTCLRLQIEWAAANGCLHIIHTYFANLPESDWHHMGD